MNVHTRQICFGDRHCLLTRSSAFRREYRVATIRVKRDLCKFVVAAMTAWALSPNRSVRFCWHRSTTEVPIDSKSSTIPTGEFAFGALDRHGHGRRGARARTRHGAPGVPRVSLCARPTSWLRHGASRSVTRARHVGKSGRPSGSVSAVALRGRAIPGRRRAVGIAGRAIVSQVSVSRDGHSRGDERVALTAQH